jgi:TonB family protein
MLQRSLLGVALATLFSVSSWAQEVYYPGNGVTLPTVVKEVHLMGPTDATVGINCVVTADGTIDRATVASSPDPKLNAAAIRALQKWQFKPGTKDGQPVAVQIFVELSIERS